MECYNCGAPVPEDATRCPQCGQRFAPRAEAEQKSKRGLGCLTRAMLLLSLVWLVSFLLDPAR